MNAKLRLLAFCALAGLLCSCAATSIKKTWKAPEGGMPVTKIAVLAIEQGVLRQGFENRFHSQLTKAGAGPLTTFQMFTLPEIKQDKRAAAERFRASGAEAVLIVRLVDKAIAYREIQTASGMMDWHDYYSVGFMNMSSTYGSLKEKILVETSLHDLTTGKRLWSALTETVVTENMDRVAEMDPLIKTIVAAMRKEAVIP